MTSGAGEVTNRRSVTLEHLPAFAQELLTHLKSRHVVLLEGPLGVGKTELVRALLVAGGGHHEASSPSFAIHNRYEFLASGGKGARLSIDHLDLYRIEDHDELESTGFWDLFSQKHGLIVIEWAERLPKEQLPRTWPQLTVQMNFTSDPNQREFILYGGPSANAGA